MMISSAYKLSFAALLLALVSGCGGKSDAEAIAAAKAAMAKRDPGSAVVELKALLQKNSGLGEARYLLGVALTEQGDYAGALLELGKARDLGFDDNLLAPKLARSLLAAGKHKEVIQAYAGSKVTPASAQAELAVAIALAHLALNQRPDAEKSLADALTADAKHPWALLTQARLLAIDGRFDQALALADQAIVPNAPNGEVHLLKGLLQGIGKKDADAAVKSFQAAALDPLHVLSARIALIQTHLSRQRLNEATAELELLKKTHAKKPQTYYLEAVLAYARKDFAQAEAIADQLLGLAPTNPRLLVLGGGASLQRGNLIAAETKLGKAVQSAEGATVARKLLTETYLRMGQPDKALATVQPLMDPSKPDGEAFALAGQAHLQAGRAREAEAMFVAAVKLKPQDVQLRTALALTDLAKGNADSAFDSLQQIAASDQGDMADMALISAHMRRAQFDAALQAIAKLESKRPGSSVAMMLRGAALKGKGDVAAARSAFEAVIKSEPKHVAAIGNLVKLDIAERQFDAARTRLKGLIDASPRDSMPQLMLLEVLEQQGAKPAELLSVVDQALQANSGDPAAYLAKMALQGRAGDVKGAASTAQLAMSRISGNADLLDAAGRALAQAGDHQQAINVFNQILQLRPGSPTPYLRQAELHSRRGDTAAAKSSLARAFEMEPQNPDVIDLYLAQAARSGDPKPALEAARQLQRRYANQPLGWSMEGDVHAQRKDWQSALTAYRAAMSKTDSPGLIPRRVHAILQSAQSTAAADRFANEWLSSRPKDLEFLEYLGSQAINAKNFPAAERYFRDALGVAPNSLVSINNFAWLLAERGDKRAVDYARQAVAQAPRSAPILDTMAKALASQGDLAEAVKAQRQAVQLQPKRAAYRVNLVELLIRQGDRQAAQEQLGELEKLGADSALGRETLANLRRKLAT